MIVTRSLHERALASLIVQLDALGLHESAGIHGPASQMWHMNAGLHNFLGAGRAILLQLAHPYVAHGIAEHSTTQRDVRQRFQATFDNVFGMTFGTRGEALAKARKVHMVHARIHGVIPSQAGRFEAGHRYHANDSDALLWVHATLIGTAMQVQELTCDGVCDAQRQRNFEASKRFALLFGLGPELVPNTYRDFEEYMRAQLAGDTLVVTKPALEMASFIFEAPSLALRPVFALYRALTASLLPVHLAAAYGMPCGAKERALAGVVVRGAKAALPRLPAGLRKVPAAMQAEARLGLRGSSAWSRVLERSMQAALGAWAREPDGRGA